MNEQNVNPRASALQNAVKFHVNGYDTDIITLCKSTTQVCAHAPVLLRHLPVRKGLCLEPKRGPGRAILYIVQCIYTGTYDPYTVDTPHDRAYRGMGGKNLQWITHALFGLRGYFGFCMQVRQSSVGVTSFQMLHVGLTYHIDSESVKSRNLNCCS